jgi:hypothetical protein
VDPVEEQKEGRPLEEVLPKCIDVIIKRLDQTGDGTVSKKDFELIMRRNMQLS